MLLQTLITYPVAHVVGTLVNVLLHQLPNVIVRRIEPRPSTVHAHDDDAVSITVVFL